MADQDVREVDLMDDSEEGGAGRHPLDEAELGVLFRRAVCALNIARSNAYDAFGGSPSPLHAGAQYWQAYEMVGRAIRQLAKIRALLKRQDTKQSYGWISKGKGS